MNLPNTFTKQTIRETSVKALKSLGIERHLAHAFEQNEHDLVRVTLQQVHTRAQIKEKLKQTPFTKAQWEELLEEMAQRNSGNRAQIWTEFASWKFQNDNNVIVHGDFKILEDDMYIETLPPGIQLVKGNIWCPDSSLVSLQNFPEAEGNIVLSTSTKLASLQGMQRVVHSSLDLGECTALKDLKGVADEIYGDLWLRRCTGLKSLRHLPRFIQSGLYLHEGSDFDYFPNIHIGDRVRISSYQVQLKSIFESRNIPYKIII